MTQRGLRFPTVAILIGSAFLVGCPLTFPPILSVSPLAISFGATATTDSFTIFNAGGQTLTWTIEESVDFLSTNVTAGSTTTETDRVVLVIDRTGKVPGTYTGEVTVRSNAGTTVVRVAMTVPGTPVIQVDPVLATLGSTATSATFTIHNRGQGDLTWNIEFLNPNNPDQTATLPDYLTVAPSSGTITPGGQDTFEVTVDRDELGAGAFVFKFRVTSNAGSQVVTLNVGVSAGAAISVNPTNLDFGTQLNQLTLEVFNSGAVGTVLSFQVDADRDDLITVEPNSGESERISATENDPVAISVRLNRAEIENQTENAVITVSAVSGEGIASVEIPVSATAAPLIFEGATNRSRPPFIMRFIFLLRDHLGKAIDATDPEILGQLQTAFTLEEDQTPVDLNETNLFVAGPTGLRYNVVLLLDYTGSMFNAGDGNGVAIDQTVDAATKFIMDLPESYRIALMEYHERQQTNRLIHSFTTDKQPAIDTLRNFTIPDADHGASEVYEAVADACQRLADEDRAVLPLDDADVRAVFFVTDGRDTSSLITVDELATKAQETRSRLYPIGFGETVANNEAVLRDLASRTGGHYYAAPTLGDLTNLFDHELTATDPGAPGVLIKELKRQIVLTYITLIQGGSHTYSIKATFQGREGFIEQDAVLALGGDVRAGQIALRTAGIQADGSAEVFVRADYAPRNVTQIRFKILTDATHPATVELASEGLLADWVLVPEGNGIFTALTTEDNPLRYGAFGDLLKISFDGIPPDSFGIEFRVDNRIYVNPPFTKFFQHPEKLTVGPGSSQASVTPLLLESGFNPDAADAWDRDQDLHADFDDLFPDDKNRF
ncbi:MAG: VWA domain-containing protein [Candidatus Hydrogenedentes bacterium]|nr:VWA domain-containing protein [Candidatus Hydrogenedentota bacterium]